MASEEEGQDGAIRLERIGAIGRAMLDSSGGPGGGEDWRRWAATYEQWVADPNVYGGLIRQPGLEQLSTIRDAKAWVGRFNRRHDDATAELANFYRLIWTIDRFSKPTVALLDGEVSWSDFCLVRHGTHKVVGDSFRLNFTAPDGWFTDAGATWWLARLPDHLGESIALTGGAIDGAQALALGLATHCISASAFDGIERVYADADPIDQVLDGLPQWTGPASIEALRKKVSSMSGGTDSKANLIRSLIAEARSLTVQQTLERDYAIALALLERGPEPLTGMKPGEYEAFRARAKAELALKPPLAVPEALG